MNPKWRKTRSGISTVVLHQFRGTVDLDHRPDVLGEREVAWEATVTAPFHVQQGRLEFGPGWTPVNRARIRLELGPGVAVRFDGFRGTALVDGTERRLDGGVLDLGPHSTVA